MYYAKWEKCPFSFCLYFISLCVCVCVSVLLFFYPHYYLRCFIIRLLIQMVFTATDRKFMLERIMIVIILSRPPQEIAFLSPILFEFLPILALHTHIFLSCIQACINQSLM